MKLIAATAIALLASTSIANAESYSFTSTATTVNQVGGPVAGGKPVGAGFSTGESTLTSASGKKSTSKLQCATWSAPPSGQFTTMGFCNGEEGASKYTVAFSCAAMNDKNTAADCWGRLTGISGTYANKTGTASWRATQGADGKSGTATGAGVWN
jgi:hypothetical protein